MLREVTRIQRTFELVAQDRNRRLYIACLLVKPVLMWSTSKFNQGSGIKNMLDYKIEIAGNYDGNTALTLEFYGRQRGNSADADYIIHIARRLMYSLQDLEKFSPSAIERAKNSDKKNDTESSNINSVMNNLSDKEKAEKVISALENARHTLVSESGLTAFDELAPTETFPIDNTQVLKAIDEAIAAIS